MMMSSPRSRLVTTSHAPTGDDDDASVVTLGDDDDIFVDKSTGDFFSTSFVLSTPGILAGKQAKIVAFYCAGSHVVQTVGEAGERRP